MASGGKKMPVLPKKKERTGSIPVKNSTNPRHSSQDVTKLKLLNEALSAKNANLQNENTDLKKEQNTKDFILEKRREQAALFEEDLSSLKAQLRKKEEEFSGVKRKLKERIGELEERNERNDTMRAGSEKEVEILKEEINRLKKEAESLKKEIVAAKESIQEKSESEKEMIKLREAVENNNQKLDMVLDHLLKGVPKDRGLGGKPSEEQVCQSKITPLIKRPLKVPDNVSGRRMWKPTGKATPGLNKPIGVSPKMDKPQTTTSKTFLPGIQPKK